MLEQVTADVWIADYDQFLPGRVNLTARMTVIRLEDGSLWLWSPIKYDADVAEAIEALGPVRFVVAPSLFHHMYLGPYLERWPQAAAYGPPGLPAKRDDLDFAGELSDEAPDSWRGQIEHVALGGCPTLNELVFFHPKSKTLIVSDLVFNLRRFRGVMTGLVLRIIGAHRRLAMSRSWRWIFVKDREAFSNSLKRILEWPFDRVIMAHGDVVDSGAHPVVSVALERMIRPD